ncbi:CLUMA_CG014009, isoform A [Clunio marinus]|uniref:CLUMA_CG014009, isoform A n=1 Tax=Clunio marinus TaxID=568069 RepID=A0A1J1IQH2_9DIPT|nr:CLUMA_CG014009, isoform A [Clunio marinus]
MDSLSSISKSTVAVGIAGALVLGYCIYFDHKRRNAKDFKKKLYQKRQERENRKNKVGKTKLPDFNDHEAVQRYFLHEIQMGEALISQGDISNGVEHLANAVIVCGQPTQLLQVLQQTLPAEVFTLLIHRMRDFQSENQPTPGMKLAESTNDDLEKRLKIFFNMIQDYEQEYGEMTAELLCLLRKFLQSDPDERSNSIKEIKEKIEACQELLEQMTIESYQHTNTDIRLSQHARIRSYRTDLERFEEEFKRAKDSFNNTPKTFLDDSEVGIDYSQREKLLNNTERLERTGNIMQDGYRTLIETEQIGVHVMANLLGQHVSAFIVPQEIPSLLSLVYSNIPPIKKGTDSRVGFGYRLGDHADFQVQFEIGPQKETQAIGSGSLRKRYTNPTEEFEAKKANKKEEFKKGEKQNQTGWLQTWLKKVNKEEPAAATESSMPKNKPIVSSDVLKQLQVLYQSGQQTVIEIQAKDTAVGNLSGLSNPETI